MSTTAAGGRPAGIEALFSTSFADVWRFVRRRTASAADADDVTADVFATAWRRREELPPADEQRLWLFGVARHTLANHQRARARRRRLSARLARQPVDRAPEPHEPDDTLSRALASLAADDRDLLVMRAWDQSSVTEIAALLGCSPNAASIRLHRARRRLADALGHSSPSDGHCDAAGVALPGRRSKEDDHG